MTKKQNTNTEESKYKFLHIAFPPEELEELDEIINQQVPKTNRSEFLRQAIREKIRRINHPELFLQPSANVSDAMLKKISEHEA